MSARPMLIVLVLLAVSLGGFVAVEHDSAPGPTGVASSADSVQSLNFSNNSGSLRFTATDLGWIDFAWPVTEDLDPEDVQINVTVVWGERPYEDRTQFWANAYLGPRYDALRGPAPATLMHMGGERYMRDGVIEAHIEAAGQDASTAIPEPVCTNRCWGNQTRFVVRVAETVQERRMYHWMRVVYDRPVVHFFVATGGMEPERLVIDAAWNGTTVTWAVGDPTDVATYYQEDFEHKTYAEVGTGIGRSYRSMVAPQYADDGTLTLDWSDPPVLFRVRTQAGDAAGVTEDEVEIRRPNGTVAVRQLSSFPYQAEIPGQWEVWYSGTAGVRDGDFPWVWAVDMEWADLPWQEDGLGPS